MVFRSHPLLGLTILVIAIGVAWGGARWLIASASPIPERLGAPESDRLPDCPESPNCVSSQAPADSPQFIEPIRISPSPALALHEARRQVHGAALKALTRLGDVRLLTVEPTYIHAEVRTPVVAFRDDVQLLIEVTRGQPNGDPEGDMTVHMRSASRLGYSDLGVNRRRLERLRTAIEDELAPVRAAASG